MIFAAPIPFHEALRSAEVRSLLPTTGSHAALSALEPDIKARALWMARNHFVSTLQSLGDGINAILSGQATQADARVALQGVFDQLGYTPDPEHEGGLRDLASTARLNLAIDTNVAIARNGGWHAQGMQADVLDAFPAQELFRAGTPKGGVAAQRDWADRWAQVGGQFFGSRMIALKTDPVWKRLGDPALFPDGIPNGWPPFALNSLMEVRDIARAEAESLGLLDKDTAMFPQPTDLSADLAAAPEVRAQWLKDAITESGAGTFDANGVLHFTEGGRP